MNVQNIAIDQLYVSPLNVRKVLSNEEDETGISDLANDIRENNLINPITVRYNGGMYEIIAGQRRYLACKLLNKVYISCNVLEVSTQKAEELSLVENIQRNPMTNVDKIKSYSKLYNVYNKDIDKVISVINISRPTLTRYLKLSSLSDKIINMLDASGEDKLSLDTAVELTKLDKSIDKEEVVDKIKSLTTNQQKQAIKQFITNRCENIDDLDSIREEIAIQQNKIELSPSVPYVLDEEGNNVIIPKHLYSKVVALIRIN